MSAAPPGGRLRAWAEVLRAPLLLSPIADVLAGWAFASGTAARVIWLGTPPPPGAVRDLVLAAVCGVCLLAAGMTQNAAADTEDDRRRKPSRPIPRGALRRGTVAWVSVTLHAAALLAAAAVSQGVLVTAALIVAGTTLYHFGLKRWRIPGCLVLGLLRGLDLRLGVLVAVPEQQASGALAGLFDSPFADATWIYACYVFAAALFASTDDEEQPSPAVRAAAISLANVLLALLLFRTLQRWPDDRGAATCAALLLLAALVRPFLALRSGIAPRVSGALLSNAYLVTGALAVMFGPWPGGAFVAALAVALFLVSRLALRSVPPS